MSSPTLVAESSQPRAGDAFAIGVLVMLLMSVLQRCIGLVRGIGFCHFLSDIELGQWALINSFFVIGVPIAVLGLPGSFGKFVEHYRRREQLGAYVRRVAGLSCGGLLVGCSLMLTFPAKFSWLIFGHSHPFGLIVWCVVAFASVALFSFTNELVAALRQVRVVSMMQFTQSGVFAALGLLMIASYRSWSVLLPCFAIASLLGAIPGWWAIRGRHGGEFAIAQTTQDTTMWRRILPYAGTLWLMNFLSNMFEVSDRYMLLHLTPGVAGQALVGQYHAAYILPNLLTSLALMLGGILLPYLSADWEAERRDQIAARLRQMLQSVCVGFLALAVGAMSLAPWLYGYGFGDRYHLAEQILPLALLQATWVSLFLIAETYMLCAERGKQLAALLIAALVVNLGLNWLLIQHFGLLGAVAATSTANLLVLLLLLWRITRSGCQLGSGTLALCFAPLAVIGGANLAMLALVVIVLIAGRSEWLLTTNDRAAIDAAVLPRLSRVGIQLTSLWP